MWQLFIVAFLCTAVESSEPTRQSTPDWDILIFTQSWPTTVCLQWKEKYENHTCLFPQNKNEWTIHGIWPTIYGTHEPGFCNSTWKFDENKIAPIEDELNTYWPNIQNGSSETSLWKHEWEKHGTCAASLPELNSELKYFQKGLEWVKNYNLSSILSQAGISPGAEGLKIQDIVNAVKSSTQKNPAVECIRDLETKEEYLLEIRICLDKQFMLIDCDGIETLSQGFLTNCPLTKDIFYPSVVPPVNQVQHSNSDDTYKKNNNKPRHRESMLLTFLKVISYVQWLTL
ncbi:ribonuclease Oy [Hetaerina americana]|uniref:ribonuclease Oy n=1 Tax=Hetaerina americana TaxID=62018 RepID=UPI003A7F269F